MKLPFFIALAALSVCAQSPTINETPTRQFGQRQLQTLNLTSIAPNLIEGRELSGPLSLAFDTSVTPPILYVADTSNNRVLAWLNPAGRQPGDVADKVIGQRDFFSTAGGGPGTTLSTGLNFPTGVAVNSRGDLYVADVGNNRILRFPQPFRQTGDLLVPDLVIGQRSFASGREPNQGLPVPSEKTLAFSSAGTAYTSRLTFDSSGNLWTTDPLNNRVLRFPTTQLNAGTLEPAADIVLGQTSFTSAALVPDGELTGFWRNKQVLQLPSGLAFDQQNRLYVADARARVVMFTTLQTGVPAARVLGVPPDPQPGQPPRVFPNSYNVGAFTPAGAFTNIAPESVALFGTNPFVFDTGDSRIMRFGSPEQWASETQSAPSPPAAAVVGQNDFSGGKTNRGQRDPDQGSLSRPAQGVFLGNDLWIADAGNNRIISLPMSGSFVFGPANHVLGQAGYTFSSPNLVEGKELFLSGGVGGGGMAIDYSNPAVPPRLYIADSRNNRVLGFRDARKVGSDIRTISAQTADIVIGQPDLARTSLNFPSGDQDLPSDQGLSLPSGVAVDGNGNLFVSDTGNGRVLRFPAPFSQPAGAPQRATLVLGQNNFVSPPIRDAGISNLSAPFGLAVLPNGSVVVSDLVHNRVVVYRKPAGGDFSNYQNASLVLGQQDFSSSTAGNGAGQMRQPRFLAIDSSERLYVADSGNNRLIVFTSLSGSTNGASSAFQLGGFNAPNAVAVSQTTGEIWVANTSNNAVFRLPEFQQLQFNPTAPPTATIGSGQPLALALDSADNLIISEGINRMVFYFAKVLTRNAANYNARPLAPGQLALVGRLGKDFALTAADGTSQSPWPIVLSDLQVTVNGIPAPIFHVLPERIDFQVPMSAPSQGRVDIVVTRVSTGEVLGSLTQDMAPSNPGFFTSNGLGFGPAAATNEDGTVNGPGDKAAQRGKVITFYLTGVGFVDGAPPDGVAPAGPVHTRVKPVMFSNNAGGLISPNNIIYSGLSPAFPGGWQINMIIPEAIPPGNNNNIGLTYNDIQSTLGPNGIIQVLFSTR